MENKIDFWKTPEGKILSYGIHEHNSGSSYISSAVKIIQRMINIGLIQANEEYMKDLLDQLDIILKGKEKQKESIDYIYSQFKSKYENGNDNL